MTLAVIGAGFGRTGTLSLKGALERLGFGPCYHMIELIEHPEHANFWQRAATGGAVDWDEILCGYRAAVDWPACNFYRPLAARYPGAKVILTLRDPGRWYESARQTIFPRITRPVAEDDPAWTRAQMQRKVVIEQAFGGDIMSRDHVLRVFRRHIEEVQRAIPPARLLAYRVADGWEPLCRFLEQPIPDEPFPQVNASEDFRRRFND
ncbi:MAG: sulfotransferase family protein [Geminicoccaceae bacterium]